MGLSKTLTIPVGLVSEVLSPTVIVVEQGELWLAALRTCLRRSSTKRVEPQCLHAPAISDVPSMVTMSPTAFLVLEVTRRSVGGLLLPMAQWRESFPNCCLVAALERQQRPRDRRDIALALLEAGAAHVVGSPRRMGELLPLLETHARAVAAEQIDRSHHAMWTKRLGAAWIAPRVDLPACWSTFQQTGR